MKCRFCGGERIMKPILTPRLQTVADMINDRGTVADIGTDHAYLPIYLISENKCRRCVAADIAVGPLNRAKEYITKYLGKTDRIETVLSDGLKSIKDPCDVITVAGMGGETIAQILEEADLKKGQTVILQPMSKAHELRKFLFENGFEINDEKAVGEGDRVYSVIYAVKTDRKHGYDPTETYISAPLLARSDEDAKRYKEKVARAVKKKLTGLEKAEIKNEAVLAEWRKIYERLEKAL